MNTESEYERPPERAVSVPCSAAAVWWEPAQPEQPHRPTPAGIRLPRAAGEAVERANAHD